MFIIFFPIAKYIQEKIRRKDFMETIKDSERDAKKRLLKIFKDYLLYIKIYKTLSSEDEIETVNDFNIYVQK